MKTIKVKENSITEFFKNYSINHKEGTIITRDRNNSFNHNEVISPYYVMKDEIFIKKNDEIMVNDDVVFSIEDISEGARTKLTNTYIYKVVGYDDICLKMELRDFTVEFEAEKK